MQLPYLQLTSIRITLPHPKVIRLKQDSDQLHLMLIPYIYTGTAQMSEGNVSLPPIVAVITTVLTLLVAMSILIVILLLWHHKRRHRLKIDSNIEDQDDSYSTLDRGTKQQIQQQSLDTHADLYGHIQLSPSTGQSELVSINESEATNTFTSTSLDHHHMQESDVAETINESLETENYNTGGLTYAVVNKEEKNKKAKSEESKEGQEKILESMSNLKTLIV